MIRDNWRIVLLVVFVVVAGLALFVPGFGVGDGGNATVTNATSGPTNLQFGLELSGGTRIRAPLVGMTAEEQRAEIRRCVTSIEATAGVRPAGWS